MARLRGRPNTSFSSEAKNLHRPGTGPRVAGHAGLFGPAADLGRYAAAWAGNADAGALSLAGDGLAGDGQARGPLGRSEARKPARR